MHANMPTAVGFPSSWNVSWVFSIGWSGSVNVSAAARWCIALGARPCLTVCRWNRLNNERFCKSRVRGHSATSLSAAGTSCRLKFDDNIRIRYDTIRY